MRWLAMAVIAAGVGIDSSGVRAESLPAGSAMAEVVRAHNRFAFKLLTEVSKPASLRNVVISPASAAFALGLVHSGARGTTAEEMARCLELQGLDRDSVNAGEGALLRSLQATDPAVELEVATSLWAAKGLKLQRAFSSLARDVYQSQVKVLDFASANAPRQINRWVREKTHGKIDRMVDVLEPDLSLVVLNAVYFNGEWLHPFDEKVTRDGRFTLADGKVVQRRMMTRQCRVGYLDDTRIQVVALPYSGQAMSFYLILPAADMTVASLLGQLDALQWKTWLAGLKPREVWLTLPRFEISADVVLDEALHAMGMEQAFTTDADFTGIAPQLFVSEVRQKARIEVTERGTVAVAVTQVKMSAGATLSPTVMTVDRPFVYAIRDDRSGLILFLGTVADPAHPTSPPSR